MRRIGLIEQPSEVKETEAETVKKTETASETKASKSKAKKTATK